MEFMITNVFLDYLRQKYGLTKDSSYNDYFVVILERISSDLSRAVFWGVTFVLSFIILSSVSMMKASAAGLQPFDWNADGDFTSGTSVVRFYSGMKNYFNGRNWETIDLQPVIVGDDIVVSKAPYTLRVPKVLGGSFAFSNDGLYDYKSDSITKESPVVHVLDLQDVKPVVSESVGNDVVYRQPYDGLDVDIIVRPRSVGVEYLFRINSLPGKKNDVKFCFSERLVGSSKRVIKKSQRVMYDSSPEKKAVSIAYIGGCKVVPYSYLETAIFPVYADDFVSVDGGTSDQGVFSYDSSGGWSEARTGANEDFMGANDTTIHVQAKSNGGGHYQIFRPHFIFATGDVVPASATITAAVIGIYHQDTQGSTARYDFVKSRVTLPLSGSKSDAFDQVGDSGIGVGTIYGYVTRNSGTTAAYLETTLTDFSLIAKGSGNTQIAYVHHDDWSNATPTNTDAGNLNSGNAASNKPYLEITYTMPASSSSSAASSTGSSLSGALITGETLSFGTLNCSAYQEYGSGTGAYVLCTAWDFLLNSDVVNASLDMMAVTVQSFILDVLVVVIMFIFVFVTFSWVRATLFPANRGIRLKSSKKKK